MMIDPKGSRPAALTKFAEAARNDDAKQVWQGVEATEERAPIPTNPKFVAEFSQHVFHVQGK